MGARPPKNNRSDFQDAASGDNSMGGVTGLLMMLFALFKGNTAETPPAYQDRFNQLGGPASTTYVNRAPLAPSTGAPSGDTLSVAGFKKLDSFPSDIRIVRAEILATRGGSPMKIRYTGENGEEVIKSRATTTAATRAWMNNNPGNLRYGENGVPSASDRARMVKEGAIAIDGNGHGIFASPEAGLRAMAMRLRSGPYSGLSLKDAIAQYAPTSDGNDPVGYAANVCSKTGISGDQRICDMNNQQLMAMVSAMVAQEGYSQRQGVISTTSNPTALPKAT